MRTNQVEGTITLSQEETRLWYKGTGPSAKGHDLGVRWAMSRTRRVLSENVARTQPSQTARVLLSDGTVAMVTSVLSEKKKPNATVRRMM